MPKHYKAQLAHTPFDWIAALDQIRADLGIRHEQILETVGFFDEYERTATDPARAAVIQEEADGVMAEITSALATATATIVDGGFKPPRLVISTLEAIKRDPGLVARATIEPETLGVLASKYQRSEETPGTHWYDLTGDLAATQMAPFDIDPERIRVAADRGIAELKRLSSKGRHHDVALARLAADLVGIYNRFAGVVKRTNVAGHETSQFKNFLRLVLPAAESVLSVYPAGTRTYRLPVDGLLKRARELVKRPGDSWP